MGKPQNIMLRENKQFADYIQGSIFITLKNKLNKTFREVCAQSCPTRYDPMAGSPPGSSVHGIPQQEYWSGLACPPPGNLPDPGIKPTSLASPALAGRFFTTSATWEACICV